MTESRNDSSGIGGAPEKRELRLGFNPLTDCASLVAAHEQGFFADEGLRVSLAREITWSAIRDKVAAGEFDGAHMLAGMPIAATLGVDGPAVPMVTALSLGLNGNAISVSSALYRRMQAADPVAMAEQPLSAAALRTVVDEDREAGLVPLTFAVVHPVSSHNYQLRYWLAAARIDPDRDVRLVVGAPARMPANLRAGRVDGFCVGEPWNQAVVAQRLGVALVAGYDLWNNAPEKVLGVTRDWAEAHPATHRALIRALVRAAAWLDQPANRDVCAGLLAGADYVDADEDVIRRSLSGAFQYHPTIAARSLPDFNVFHRYAANFPWQSHAVWFITQMQRWRQLATDIDPRQSAARVYLPDVYREAVVPLGIPVPDDDDKTEGEHDAPRTLETATGALTLGADRFLDGRVFDPSQPKRYRLGLNGAPRGDRPADAAQAAIED